MRILAADRVRRGNLERHLEAFLDDLRVRNYSKSRISGAYLTLAFFFRYLNAQKVCDVRRVDESHLAGFARNLSLFVTKFGKPMSTASQRYYLGTVRGFFRFLEATNQILQNPARDLPLPRIQSLPRGVLTMEQARRLMNAPSPFTPWGLRDRAMLELFYGTGIRLRECLNLELSDVDLAEQLLLIRDGKGKKDRMVPIPGRAAVALDIYLREARSQLIRDPRVSTLFLSMRGNKVGQSTLSAAFHQYGRTAGIPGRVSPHLLRHTCATHLLKRGADIRHVQELLGHKHIETTAIYTRVAVKDLHEVLAKAHPRDRRRPSSRRKRTRLTPKK